MGMHICVFSHDKCVSHLNDGFIWHCLGGKRDEKLILPLNDSISTTLSTDQVHVYIIKKKK